jgi:hypothetical protein
VNKAGDIIDQRGLHFSDMICVCAVSGIGNFLVCHFELVCAVE